MGHSRLPRGFSRLALALAANRAQFYPLSGHSLAGKGSKNSGPTWSLPFSEPGWRFFFTSPIAIIRAADILIRRERGFGLDVP